MEAKRATLDDAERVKEIMIHPKVYPWIIDDGSPTSEDFDSAVFLRSEAIYTLMPNYNSLAIFVPVNSFTYDQHTCVLPESRGVTTQLGRAVWRYMFERTKCEKITTWIPVFNRPALAAALAVGFEKEGLVTSSFKRKGKLYDQFILGITKEKWLCQQ